MLYIGVDLGTSAVKLLLMDGKGQIKRLFQENTRCIFHSRAGRNSSRKIGIPRRWRASGNYSWTRIKDRWRVSASADRCTGW